MKPMINPLAPAAGMKPTGVPPRLLNLNAGKKHELPLKNLLANIPKRTSPTNIEGSNKR